MRSWIPGIAQNIISTGLLWIGGLVVGGLAVLLAYLTPAIRAFAPLSYLFTALIALVLLSILAYFAVRAVRHYKPYTGADAGLPLLDHPEGDQTSNEVARAHALIQLLERNVEALSVEMKQELAEHKKHMSDCYSAQDEARRKEASSLVADIQELRRACASVEEKVTENEKRLRESLHAVFARECLKRLAGVIDGAAAELGDRLEEGEHYTAMEWDSWVNAHHRWESALNQWIDVGRWYAQGVRDKILTVDDQEYSNDWVVRDEQFPNADAVWRFKKHRIIHAHWLSIRGEVHRGAELVAFSAQAERDLHRGQYHQ